MSGARIRAVQSRILIVDDDPQVLKLFTKLLTQSGYSVQTEISGQNAIEAMKRDGPFDLVVLDLSMPEPDGFATLKQLRAVRPGLRILVTSGFMGGALLEASELLGATSSLNKAEAPEHLVQKVADLLRR
jgi:CheY-like chemotaxis protein